MFVQEACSATSRRSAQAGMISFHLLNKRHRARPNEAARTAKPKTQTGAAYRRPPAAPAGKTSQGFAVTPRRLNCKILRANLTMRWSNSPQRRKCCASSPLRPAISSRFSVRCCRTQSAFAMRLSAISFVGTATTLRLVQRFNVPPALCEGSRRQRPFTPTAPRQSDWPDVATKPYPHARRAAAGGLYRDRDPGVVDGGRDWRHARLLAVPLLKEHELDRRIHVVSPGSAALYRPANRPGSEFCQLRR